MADNKSSSNTVDCSMLLPSAQNLPVNTIQAHKITSTANSITDVEEIFH